MSCACWKNEGDDDRGRPAEVDDEVEDEVVEREEGEEGEVELVTRALKL